MTYSQEEYNKFKTMCEQVADGELDAQWLADHLFDAYQDGTISSSEYDYFMAEIDDYIG